LSKSGKYSVIVLTRDSSGSRAKDLALLPGVSLAEGSYQNETTLRQIFRGAYGAFVNTDGFAIGEQAEVFWGIRIFEIAVESGLKHYIWGALDYSLKIGEYDPAFRCGHYDGKGRVTEWLLAQTNVPIATSVLTTGPYIEMLQGGLFVPSTRDDGKTLVFRYPLGEHGTVPMVHLEDIGFYAHWLFDSPSRAKNLDLKVAVAQIRFEEIVKEFNNRTTFHGRTAVYEPAPSFSAWTNTLPVPRDAPVTSIFYKDSKYTEAPTAAGLTYYENFAGFTHLWQSNRVQRDYALLDEIHPDRIKSVGEWMDKVKYDGTQKSVLKDISG
ncbi:hypothetical protein HK100_008206, partial [Physocladia obscura]